MTYDSFKTQAFVQYGIPVEPLEVVRNWVLKEIGDTIYMGHPCDDLGFAELGDVDTIDKAMTELKEIIWRSSLMETEKMTARELKKFYKDAGGRIGKGFYRYALKAYYLTLPTRPEE